MGVAKVYPHSKVHGPLKYSIQRRIRSNAPVLLIMGATCCTLLWLGQLLGQLLSPLPRPLPAMPHSPREIVQHSSHAIIVPAGGQLDVDGPPPHVAARLELAAKLYKVAPSPKPFVITTAWGTPHKACPHDTAGFERHEAADNAAALLALGVSPAHVLEESVSLETVGNAYFTRLLHTDVRGLQRLVVINNRFHMPRTRAVFDHVFALPLLEGMPHANYDLEYIEVDDRLDPEVFFSLTHPCFPICHTPISSIYHRHRFQGS